MSQKTVVLNVPANTLLNLGKALTAGGYKGTYQLTNCVVLNLNAETLYLHLSDDGNVPPATGTDGFPINNTTAPSSSFVFSQHHPEVFMDAGTSWVYAANAVTIKVLAIGGGS